MLELLKSLIIKVKDIAYKLGLISDYVVEWGTSGIWTYRKWNSGIAECWSKKANSLTGVVSPVALFGAYYTYVPGISLPFEMIYDSMFVTGNARLGSGIGFLYGGANTSTTVNIYVVGNQATTEILAQINVIGLWKELGGVVHRLLNHLKRGWIVC